MSRPHTSEQPSRFIGSTFTSVISNNTPYFTRSFSLQESLFLRIFLEPRDFGHILLYRYGLSPCFLPKTLIIVSYGRDTLDKMMMKMMITTPYCSRTTPPKRSLVIVGNKCCCRSKLKRHLSKWSSR